MPSVEPLDETHAAEARALLLDAFDQDPMLRWCFLAERPGFEERLRGYVECGHRWHTAQGHPVVGVFEGGRLASVAYLMLPEPPNQSAIDPLMDELASRCGAEAQDRFRAYGAAVSELEPEGDFFVVALIGTRPGSRGRGFASLILADVARRLSRETRARGILLDTALDENVRFYERRGYLVIGETQIGGVHVRMMCNPAQGVPTALPARAARLW
jgi:GNAT superfamily N-acetyltransferase